MYTAAPQGVAIRMLAAEGVGRIDLASFPGLPGATPAGYSAIRVDCRARGPRHATSPVTDTLRRPVTVELTVNGMPAGG